MFCISLFTLALLGSAMAESPGHLRSVTEDRGEETPRHLGYCEYECPDYSDRKPDRNCYNNFDDCECWDGFFKYNGGCVHSHPDCRYKCPENSYPKEYRNCYNNFDDCECKDGFVKKGGKCVKSYPQDYKTLKITNLSFQQPFGAFFVATHNEKTPPLFEFGKKASDELARLAEDGDPSKLVNLYKFLPGVGEAFSFDKGAPYFGGETLFIEIPDDPKYPYVTVASMAINTNDCFISINGRVLDSGDVFTGVGYDAGSEENNELCKSIPGPACAKISNLNVQSGNGEGFVHVHRGFHGVDKDLTAVGYDWRNPMVRWEVI